MDRHETELIERFVRESPEVIAQAREKLMVCSVMYRCENFHICFPGKWLEKTITCQVYGGHDAVGGLNEKHSSLWVSLPSVPSVTYHGRMIASWAGASKRGNLSTVGSASSTGAATAAWS
jgi:hypothetical protein